MKAVVDLEQAFIKQATRLFSLCETYIDGTYSQEEREPLFGLITKLYDGLEVDFGKMFEEVMANLEEPMSEQQRERYCFSLLTPFEAYSNTLYPKVLISKSQDSIGKLQGIDGADKLVSIFENQINDANERANKYLGLGFDADAIETGDEAKSIFFELAQIVLGYGNMLDAAFVMHGLDLRRLQERCGVWVKRYYGGEAERNIRAMDIRGYVGSLSLAEEYISRLEPQEATETELLADTKQEPQQGEQEQQGGTKQPKQLGRKMKAIKDLILPTDKEQVLEKLRVNMQGQNQDTAMAILINALNNKVLLKPSWKAFCDAFPNVKIAEATYYSKLKKAGWGQS